MISFPRTITKNNKSRTDQDIIIPEKLKLLEISYLKAEQKQAAAGVRYGKDVMAILPTGFGKLVIFELFTLVKMQEDKLTKMMKTLKSWVFLL